MEILNAKAENCFDSLYIMINKPDCSYYVMSSRAYSIGCAVI
jgi:hypothetical protein